MTFQLDIEDDHQTAVDPDVELAPERSPAAARSHSASLVALAGSIRLIAILPKTLFFTMKSVLHTETNPRKGAPHAIS